MKTIDLYASFGVLAHEYKPVYTFDAPVSSAYDKYVLTVPDGWSIDRAESGDAVVTAPDGTTYTPSEILTNRGDRPAFCWFDGQSRKYCYLDNYITKR